MIIVVYKFFVFKSKIKRLNSLFYHFKRFNQVLYLLIRVVLYALMFIKL